MIIFKCKMCGGDLHPEENATTCECEYCGSVQTIPTADNEKKGNLFNRANRLRMAAEYDKAASVYTSITAEFPEEAEAYWGLCLCKYGIEYVEDPVTAKKIPTCHRTRSESIMDDPDFDQACENADAVAKRVYREEAKAIDRLQQDILSVVANESPYDVFICYKETDDDGQRTEDSVLAQDIYDALTAKGLKVFFARITLEDKLGQQYEPYIYAALHSAKVMLAIGTQFEYFDTVWVKNEWSRFLDMMKIDKSKTLIPCYKDIDAYDMPREFKNLQAQDMNKLGWLQDLARGVVKLCGKDQIIESRNSTIVQQVVHTGGPTVDSMLKRVFMFLEDGEFDRADNLCEQVLNADPENARAYLGKLMAQLRVKKQDEMKNCANPFDGSDGYKKIMRFGDEVQKKQLQDDVQYIKKRNEYNRRSSLYKDAVDKLRNAETIEECNNIKNLLATISDYEGVEELIKDCEDKIVSILALQAKIQLENELREKQRIATIEKKEKVRKESEMVERAVDIVSKLNITQDNLSTHKMELMKAKGLFAGKRKQKLEEYISAEEAEIRQMNHKLEILKNNSGLVQEYLNNQMDRKEIQYRIALMYLEAKLFYEAYTELSFINGYKDVNELLLCADLKDQWKDCSLQIKRGIRDKKQGEELYFGHYPQSQTSILPEPIAWIVLENDGRTCRIISKFLLEVKPYNDEQRNNDWEGCTLRKWLNNEFYIKAFTILEQQMIQAQQIELERTRTHSANVSGLTQDRVTLLTCNEVKKYSKIILSHYTGKLTVYAIDNGANAQKDDIGSWWLRTPGLYDNDTAVIREGTVLDTEGEAVNTKTIAIRPVIMVNLR